MNAAAIRDLYAYNDWATRRVLEAAGNAPAEAWTTTGADGATSVRSTLVHLVSTQRAWLAWIDGSLPAAEAYALSLDPEAYQDAASLLAAWEGISAATDDFLATLDDRRLDEVFEASGLGMAFRLPLWKMLVHLVNHGTQHRSEAATLLTAAGASPGGLDMVWYFLQREQERAGQ